MKPIIYPGIKLVHSAKIINPTTGAVYSLCAQRAMDLSKELWTIVDADVTCERCLTAIDQRKKAT